MPTIAALPFPSSELRRKRSACTSEDARLDSGSAVSEDPFFSTATSRPTNVPYAASAQCSLNAGRLAGRRRRRGCPAGGSKKGEGAEMAGDCADEAQSASRAKERIQAAASAACLRAGHCLCGLRSKAISASDILTPHLLAVDPECSFLRRQGFWIDDLSLTREVGLYPEAPAKP